MTNEERDLITRFIERVSGAAAPGGSGSVPSTGSSGLAPVDPEADALIGQLMTQHPEARYRITQLAFVQEHALEAAQQRISALQAQMQQMQQGQASGGGQPSPWGAGAQPAQQPQSHGLFSTLFGSRSSAPPQPGYQPPPQQPQYAQPQYAPQYGGAPAGMMQQQGSGFLGGALRTAAGVAGGLVAGNALMSLFEGNRGGGFGGGFGSEAGMPGGGLEPGGGFGTPGGWVDNGSGMDQGGGFSPDPYDQGGALKSDPASDPFASGQQGGDQGSADAGGWTPAADQSGGGGDPGWQDAPPDAGGFDAGSGGGDGGWTDSSSDI